MAEIMKLTNKTRASLRAPLRPSLPVSAALLAELLPVIKKSAAARKKNQPARPPSAPAAQSNMAQKNAVKADPPAAEKTNGQAAQPARTNSAPNGKPAGFRADGPRPTQHRPADNHAVPPSVPPVEKRPASFTTPRSPLPRAAPTPPKQNPEPPIKSTQESPKEKPAVPPPPSFKTPPVHLPENAKPGMNGNGKAEPHFPPNGRNGNGKNGHDHSSALFRSGTLPGTRFPQQNGQNGTPRPNTASQPPLEPHAKEPQPRREQAQPPVNGNASGYQNGRARSEAAPAAGRPASRSADLLGALDTLFQAQPELPAQAAVLGVCDDGFPVLLDLNDPNPGALVVIGDERQQQLDLLRSAVASIVKRNSARSVQILVVSCEPKVWQQWISSNGFERYFIGVEGVEDLDALGEWIIRLGDWTEQRRLGERSGPPVMVVLDTLSFMTRLEYNLRLNFEWMVKEGPAAAIWPLAAISTDLALSLNSRRLLRSFHTRVLGFSDDASFYQKMNGMSEQAAREFGEPGVFAVQLGEHWMRFRLPGR